MNRKQIFLSAMDKDEAEAAGILKGIQSAGMDAEGHFWDTTDKDLTRALPHREIEKADAWVILASRKLTSDEQIGLTLTLMSARAWRKSRLPVLIVGPEQALPPLLADAAEFCPPEKLTTRLAVRTSIAKKWNEQELRICVRFQSGVGIWIEAGPSQGETWKGVLLGVDPALGGAIDFQAVGPRGSLPERTVLEHPMKDARLSAGETEYVAWGCSNTLTSEDSFFVRLKGLTSSLLLGEGLAEEDSMECRVIRLTAQAEA